MNLKDFKSEILIVSNYCTRRGYRQKNKPPQNFSVSRFYQIYIQSFPDFSLTKFFKVRKCERCGSLNPRLYNGFRRHVKFETGTTTIMSGFDTYS